MSAYQHWTSAIPAGKTWRSDDGLVSAWRVSGGECRLQTSDPKRITRLNKLSNVRPVGYAFVGGPMALYRLSTRKMNTRVIQRVCGVTEADALRRFSPPKSTPGASAQMEVGNHA